MIIKSKSQRSSGAAKRILEYISRPNAVIKNDEGKAILFKHNIKGKSLEDLVQNFVKNEATRSTRSNRIYAYHEIIAFLAEDKSKLSNKILEDIGHVYLEMRAPTGMSVFTIHEDKHPHLHLLIGATEIASHKALRISKQEFADVKVQLQEYQRLHYPQLQSVVEHGKATPWRESENQRCLKERTGNLSRKEEIKNMLEKAFQDSMSTDDFYVKACEKGLSLYEQNGIIGVEDFQNFKLSTLGFNEDRMMELANREERLLEMDTSDNSCQLDWEEVEKTNGLEEKLQQPRTDRMEVNEIDPQDAQIGY
jgi:hypothetical protein